MQIPTSYRGPRSRKIDLAAPGRLTRPLLIFAAALFAALLAPTGAPHAQAQSDLLAKVGEKAPSFTLRDTEGQEHALATYLAEGRTVVLEWFNPDCPFVKKHHQANRTMRDLEKAYRSKNVVWLAVNSGAPGKQGHGLDRNRAARKEYKIDYPILLDESGRVGMVYGAKTTPHMFVIGPDGTLVYQGAIDDEASPSKLGRTNYVKAALEAISSGRSVATAQTKSYGCSVKYSAG